MDARWAAGGGYPCVRQKAVGRRAGRQVGRRLPGGWQAGRRAGGRQASSRLKPFHGVPHH